MCWFRWLERARLSDASITAMLEALAANSRHSMCKEVPLRQDASLLGLLREEASHSVTRGPSSQPKSYEDWCNSEIWIGHPRQLTGTAEMPIGDLMVPSDKTYRSAWPPRLSKRRVLMRCPPRTPKRAPFQLG